MRIAILILFCVFNLSAEARLKRPSFEGVRPMGMGNAFMATADDQNALFYNPAGLARIKGVHFHLFDVTLGVDSLETLTSLVGAILDGNYDSTLRTDTQYARVSFMPTFVTPFFGFSIYGDFNTFYEMESLTLPQVDILSTNDVGAIVGIGLPVGEYFSVGASARIFQRFQVDEFLTPADLLAELGIVDPSELNGQVFTLLSQRVRSGWALGINAGALVTIPLKGRRSTLNLAATIEDFATTRFTQTGGIAAPNDLDMKFNFGSTLTYGLSRANKIRLALDWKDAFGSETLFKSVQLGMELDLNTVSLTFGINQGRPAGGVNVKVLPHTRINFTTYGVELGDTLWEREHRWYLLQTVIGFNPL